MPSEGQEPIDILDLVDRLEIGTRIRFNRALIDPACGDHPDLLYAKKGETGVVTGYGAKEGYWAKTDMYPVTFGVRPCEFDVIVTENLD